MVAVNTVNSLPTLFYGDGYVMKFNYSRSGTIAESSVEFIYKTGNMNNSEPLVDKIYKRLASEHSGTGGSIRIDWETENASGSWEFDLGRFPNRWQSFFHDNAMGEILSLTFYKNDLEDFTLREFKGFYTPQPMLI
jgi:hypothetical protein